MSVCVSCLRPLYTVCMRDPCNFRRSCDEHGFGNIASTVRKTRDIDEELRSAAEKSKQLSGPRGGVAS